MKNVLKLFGTAALVAVIGFSMITLSLTGCDNGGGDDNGGGGGGGGGGGASGKNLSPKTYLGRGSNQDSLEFTSATNVTYRNPGRNMNIQGTYTVSENTVTYTGQYEGETLIWNGTLGNNDDTLTVQSATGSFKPNIGYVFVNKAANVSAFAGTWNASGGRSCTFTGNNFDYKVNGTTLYSGSFYAAGSTIIFVVSAGSVSGNYTLSGNTLTLSNMGSDVDGTYTKDGSSGGGTITASDLILPNGQIWLATHSSGNKEGWIFKANGDLDHLYDYNSDYTVWKYGEQWKWQLNGTTLTFSQRDGSGNPWSYANVARNGNTLTMDNYTATVQAVTTIKDNSSGGGGGGDSGGGGGDSGGSTPTVPLPPTNGTLAEKLAWVLNQDNVKNGETYTLEVNANESLAPQDLTYTVRNNITIILKGIGTEKSISLSAAGSLFTIKSGVTLVLDENITLQGGASNNNALVKVDGGALTMKQGAQITNNTSSYTYGGGVYVYSGTFTMDGGKISGNKCGTYGSGGGVALNSGTTFIMNGGEISGNTAGSSGGGVYMGLSGTITFTMNGGKISGNTAGTGNSQSYGGGVYVSTGTFTMNNGEISGNTCSNLGGGICLGNNAIFRIVNGTVYGSNETDTSLKNTAVSNSNSVAAISVGSGGATAQRGTFNGSTWVSKGNISTTNDTVKVTNGEIVQ